MPVLVTRRCLGCGFETKAFETDMLQYCPRCAAKYGDASVVKKEEVPEPGAVPATTPMKMTPEQREAVKELIREYGPLMREFMGTDPALVAAVGRIEEATEKNTERLKFLAVQNDWIRKHLPGG